MALHMNTLSGYKEIHTDDVNRENKVIGQSR